MSLNATNALELSVDAYCTMSHINGLLPYRTFDGASKPTLRQCVEIARDHFQMVNSVLDVLGYVIPVASGNTTSMRVLGRLNALGAAATIEETANSGNADPSAHSRVLREQFSEVWVSFEKGRMSLPGATRQGTFIPNRKERTVAGSFDTVSGTEQDPVFTKGMNF